MRLAINESSPDGKGGNYIDVDCDCEFAIDDIIPRVVSTQDGQKDVLEFKLRVTASTVPEMIGRERKEDFYVTPNAASRLFELACAVGMYSKPQWRADKEAGIDPDIPIDSAHGLRFCAPVKMKPGKNDPSKLWPNIGGDKGFTFWGCGDEEAFHIPLDPDYVALENEGGGLVRKDGTRFKRAAAPMPRPTPQANGHANGAAHPATRAAAPATRPAAAPPAATRPTAPAVTGAARSLI